jgi:hypothetical protein
MTPNPDIAAHKHLFKDNETYAGKMRMKHAKFSVILNHCLIAGALLFIRCLLAMNSYFNTMDMSMDADISATSPCKHPRQHCIVPVLSSFSHEIIAAPCIHRTAAR